MVRKRLQYLDQLYLHQIVDIGTAEVYPFTYTAPDDNAGNPGQSATINIIVKNINQTGTTILSSSIIPTSLPIIL